MSHLLDFYLLEKPDSEGRMLSEIWNWDNDELEHCHDFIQWLFPLNEPSAFNADAPLVTDADRAAFRTTSQFRTAMRRSLALFLAFVGLKTTDSGQIMPGDNFRRRLSIWSSANHNWLRITRVLKSLRLLGFEDEAGELWFCLKELHEKGGFVSEESFAYWRAAASGLEDFRTANRR